MNRFVNAFQSYSHTVDVKFKMRMQNRNSIHKTQNIRGNVNELTEATKKTFVKRATNAQMIKCAVRLEHQQP